MKDVKGSLNEQSGRTSHMLAVMTNAASLINGSEIDANIVGT